MRVRRVFVVPLTLVLLSLCASAYVLGLTFDGNIPLFEVYLDRHCSGVPKKSAYYRPETAGPVQGFPYGGRGLDVGVDDFGGKHQCSGVKLGFPQTEWGVLASVDYGKKVSSSGVKIYNVDLWPLRDKQYPNIVEYYTPDPDNEFLGQLFLSGPKPRKVGFATKGIILNLNVDPEQEGDLYLQVELPEGYVLDPTTAPTPQLIRSTKPGATNIYQFVLNRGEFSYLPGHLTASLKLVYYSESKRKLQDDLLFVLAAIFGCAVQLLIDATRTLRAASRRNLGADDWVI